MNLHEDAESIFRAAVARVDPSPMIERAISVERGVSGTTLIVKTDIEEAKYNLDPGGHIFAAGMGKASARMAHGLERALGKLLCGGIVAVKEGYVERLDRIHVMEAGHPVPDERSLVAANTLLNLGLSLGTALTERDIVIVLVSGGGSAILCAPADGLSLADKIVTTQLLLESGATINEINCVRKHLSAVKGGRLAAAFAPASVLTLVLSDVVGDDLDSIASGPTVPDPTSFADAFAVVDRYRLSERLPPRVLTYLDNGRQCLIPDTPKPGNAIFSRVRTMLIGNNRLALMAAETEARQRGYECLVLSSRVTGEAREIALVYLGIGKDISTADFPLKRPACIVAGGETTVTLRAKGKGGRNQEMALAFLAALGRFPKGGEDLVFLSAGTDGSDGPTDAAGALVDYKLFLNACAAGLNPDTALSSNDSYTFFSKAGGHVKTGPTNTNVCDIQVLLVP